MIEEGANTHYKVWICFPVVIVGIIYDRFRVVPCFPHFSEAKGRKRFFDRTLKAIKENRVTSWPTPLKRSRDVLFIQPLVVHELVSIVFLNKSECGNFDYSFSRNFKPSLGKERISQWGWAVETFIVCLTQSKAQICLLVENNSAC